MCLIPVFSVGLTTLAAPDQVSGIPSIADGDSIRIGNLSIRIHGINAPERRQPCRYAQGEYGH